MEADEALALLGRYGRWQVFYFVVLSVGMMFPSCWQVLNYLFQAYTPPHHCRVDNNNNTGLNSLIPWDKETNSYSSCLIYVNGSRGNESRDCSDDVNDWTYYDDDVTDTVVSDWNLVCERDSLKRLTSTINSLGIVLGTMFFTPLIDYYGRRPLFLINQYIMVGVGVWNAFTYNYYVYCVVRFLAGFIRPGLDLAAYVLACELFQADQRSFAGIIIEDFWGVAICILAMMMYLVKNWRHLQLILSLFGLVFVPFYWFLPESIPWLISKDRLDEAERTIQSAARFNRIKSFPSRIFKAQDEVDCQASTVEKSEIDAEEKSCWKRLFCRKVSTRKNYSLLDVLRHNRLRWFMFATSCLWIINNTVYYGMTLNTEELAGDRYLNLFISGLVEIPAYTSAYFLIHKFGRRYPLVVLHILAGVFLIISQFIPEKTDGGTNLLPLEIALVMLGKFGITATFAIVYLFTPELFPTTIRSQSLGVAVVIGRTGGLLAPFSSALNDIQPWLTAVVFGVVSIFGGLLGLTLPETNKRPLPQTIEDIEAWYSEPSSEYRSSSGSSEKELPVNKLSPKSLDNSILDVELIDKLGQKSFDNPQFFGDADPSMQNSAYQNELQKEKGGQGDHANISGQTYESPGNLENLPNVEVETPVECREIFRPTHDDKLSTDSDELCTGARSSKIDFTTIL